MIDIDPRMEFHPFTRSDNDRDICTVCGRRVHAPVHKFENRERDTDNGRN